MTDWQEDTPGHLYKCPRMYHHVNSAEKYQYTHFHRKQKTEDSVGKGSSSGVSPIEGEMGLGAGWAQECHCNKEESG